MSLRPGRSPVVCANCGEPYRSRVANPQDGRANFPIQSATCGHSICQQCHDQLFPQGDQDTEPSTGHPSPCPICHTPHAYQWNKVNYNYLACAIFHVMELRQKLWNDAILEQANQDNERENEGAFAAHSIQQLQEEQQQQQQQEISVNPASAQGEQDQAYFEEDQPEQLQEQLEETETPTAPPRFAAGRDDAEYNGMAASPPPPRALEGQHPPLVARMPTRYQDDACAQDNDDSAATNRMAPAFPPQEQDSSVARQVARLPLDEEGTKTKVERRRGERKRTKSHQLVGTARVNDDNTVSATDNHQATTVSPHDQDPAVARLALEEEGSQDKDENGQQEVDKSVADDGKLPRPVFVHSGKARHSALLLSFKGQNEAEVRWDAGYTEVIQRATIEELPKSTPRRGRITRQSLAGSNEHEPLHQKQRKIKQDRAVVNTVMTGDGTASIQDMPEAEAMAQHKKQGTNQREILVAENAAAVGSLVAIASTIVGETSQEVQTAAEFEAAMSSASTRELASSNAESRQKKEIIEHRPVAGKTAPVALRLSGRHTMSSGSTQDMPSSTRQVDRKKQEIKRRRATAEAARAETENAATADSPSKTRHRVLAKQLWHVDRRSPRIEKGEKKKRRRMF